MRFVSIFIASLDLSILTLIIRKIARIAKNNKLTAYES